MDGQGCTCGADWYGDCGCGADWTDSEKAALEAELAEARKDVARMDTLEKRDCWIGVYGEYDVSSEYAAGGGYCDTVRGVCDRILATAEPNPPSDTGGTQHSS